jgi:hypothetical protein
MNEDGADDGGRDWCTGAERERGGNEGGKRAEARAERLLCWDEAINKALTPMVLMLMAPAPATRHTPHATRLKRSSHGRDNQNTSLGSAVIGVVESDATLGFGLVLTDV